MADVAQGCERAGDGSLWCCSSRLPRTSLALAGNGLGNVICRRPTGSSRAKPAGCVFRLSTRAKFSRQTRTSPGLFWLQSCRRCQKSLQNVELLQPVLRDRAAPPAPSAFRYSLWSAVAQSLVPSNDQTAWGQLLRPGKDLERSVRAVSKTACLLPGCAASDLVVLVRA